MEKKIVLVGAGYAGILTAKKLAKKFKKNKDVSITIIDRNPFHTMLTELHEVAAGRVDEDSIKISLKKIFAKRKVDVVQDEVVSIDFENKKVVGRDSEYDYDIVVLAAGSQPTFFGVPGSEFAFKLWSYEDAVVLKDHIQNMFRKAVVETDPTIKKQLLTFYVVGAGFTGVEMAGELAEYVPFLCEKYEIERDLVSIVNVDILTRTVPILPEKLSAKVEKRMKKMGIEVKLSTSVYHIGEDFIDVQCGDLKCREMTNTVIWAAGVESADVTKDAAQKLEAVGRGRIQTDAYLRSTEDDSVYVLGDNMFYVPEGESDPVPQMVENCEHGAATAAHNIVCQIEGKGEMEEYQPSFHGVMVCIGGRYGVARVGLPNLMFNLPSFLAMLSKHFINIIYFIQVLGWNKVFSYMKHEFFTIRNNRSFVGGHFSNKTPSFLLVAIRVWLGAVWCFEGIMKIVEGWMKTPMLEGFFNGANGWYDTIIGKTSVIADVASSATGAAETVVDTVTAATGATGGGEAVGTVIFNFDFLWIFKAIFVSGKTLAESTISDFAFKLDITPMNWFVDSVIIPHEGLQMFMQIFIVVAEILIGLALIGGLFTTPASAFSLVLQFMFITTTGLYLSTFWMIFAAITLLIGGGRAFGLDYYVMPYLKKKWRKTSFARKSYLYHD